MKKILLSVITILLISGCSNKNLYETISYNKYNEMINNKDSFILFIGSDSCSHCSSYKVKVNKLIKAYGLNIKYINIGKMKDDDLNTFQSNINFNGTPTTIFIKDGEEYCGEDDNCSYYRISGDKDYDFLIKKLKQKGYIEV